VVVRKPLRGGARTWLMVMLASAYALAQARPVELTGWDTRPEGSAEWCEAHGGVYLRGQDYCAFGRGGPDPATEEPTSSAR
jgi:hypothetical protein